MDKSGANILIIDDEIGMREGCRRALVPQGFQVSAAEHGVEGLRKLREAEFDVVLVDAMLPGMSGLEILERVQTLDPDIVCVMITGFATVDLAAQAMKQGAHDFLAKPFTSDELLTVVRRALEERRRRLEHLRQKEEEEETLLLERTRQERARLDAIESRFMLVLVHELRNPAGVIKNYLQLMRAGYVDAEEWDDYLQRLDARAGQLLSMLDDLLELANLKGRHGAGRPQPLDAAAILSKITDKFKPVAEAKGLDFHLDLQAQPVLSAQSAHLESLWTHLIENAVQYTPQGQISITLAEDKESVLTVVADTGIGISTEELTRVFQEFYRADAAKGLVELGTGLGLPIVNQIVEIYQGTLRVDSTPGEGSVFTVTLPRAQRHPES